MFDNFHGGYAAFRWALGARGARKWSMMCKGSEAPKTYRQTATNALLDV